LATAPQFARKSFQGCFVRRPHSFRELIENRQHPDIFDNLPSRTLRAYVDAHLLKTPLQADLACVVMNHQQAYARS